MTQHDNGITFDLTDDQIMKQLALRWKDRREALGIKPKTVKHAEQQLSFFIGAMHTMEMCGRQPPRVALLVLSVNRDAVEVWGNLDV